MFELYLFLAGIFTAAFGAFCMFGSRRYLRWVSEKHPKIVRPFVFQNELVIIGYKTFGCLFALVGIWVVARELSELF